MAQQTDALITEVDSAQVQELCIIFLKQCPSGALHLHEFKRIFGVQSSSSEESIFLETIFRSFDTNRVRVVAASPLTENQRTITADLILSHQDNTLDFLEYVSALNLILRGNLEDRLKWSFKMYDKDGNGKLDRQEVTRIIRILYKIKLQRGEIDMTPSQICDRLFELIDQNNDGQITLAEFMEGAQKDEWVRNLLKLDVNIGGWVIQNCTKLP
uniref:Guanylate cyclase activator 1g n=1 Tax=Oryzias melastigma TaxID=30732 RepID=A0A3B3DKN7_ORYME